MLRECGRVWQSMAAGMATKSCRASPGSQQGRVWGPGAVCTLCFRESLPLPGLSRWGHRDQLELWELEGTGAMAAATPWDGALGGGKVTVALAVTGQGQGNLTTKGGERGWFAPSSTWCSWWCHSAACGHPLLGHRVVSRLQAWALAASSCPMPLEVTDCCSSARGG